MVENGWKHSSEVRSKLTHIPPSLSLVCNKSSKSRTLPCVMWHLLSPCQSMRGMVPSLPASPLCVDTSFYLQASITYKNMKALSIGRDIFPFLSLFPLAFYNVGWYWFTTGPCSLGIGTEIGNQPLESAFLSERDLPGASLSKTSILHTTLQQLVKTAACFPRKEVISGVDYPCLCLVPKAQISWAPRRR